MGDILVLPLPATSLSPENPLAGPLSSAVVSLDEDLFSFQISEDLVPIRPKHLSAQGEHEVSLDDLDLLLVSAYLAHETESGVIDYDVEKRQKSMDMSKLQIYEDGGAVGCGGILWIAGKLLALYLFNKWPTLSIELSSLNNSSPVTNILELGSGTGISGIALGKFLSLIDYNSMDFRISTTDIGDLVPIMKRNIRGNELHGVMQACELFWGVDSTDIPLEIIGNGGVDLILAADCVYNEKAFDILIKTLADVSRLSYTKGKRTCVLMASRLRRKADKRFYKQLRKEFDYEELSDFPEYWEFKKQSVFILKMYLKEKLLVSKC